MRSFLQEPEAQRLPDASEAYIDRKHYYRQFLHGYYQFDCVVSESTVRSAKFYIPEGSVYNQPTVFVGVPGGYNPWEFMVQSRWKQLADQYGLYLVLMEAADENGWCRREEDLAYLDALNNDIALRPMFCSFQASFYTAAYGDAADAVGAHSRRNPRAYSGTALIGTKGMSEEECRWLEETGSRVEGVSLSQIQHPVWLVYSEENEAVRRELSYYKRANHALAEAKEEKGRTTWLPEKGGSIDEHWCAKTAAEVRDWEDCLEDGTSEQILTELFDGILRYPGTNNGALRKVENIYDRGLKRFSAPVWGGYYQDKRDMYQREWYVYVPESAPAEGEMPAVFVFHGAGGSGDEIADRMGWSAAADRYGFMLVMPTASEPNEVRSISDIRTNNIFRPMWNTGYPQPERPEDMRFLDFLYQWVTKTYPVDKSRIYASGQSSGGMMSWACAAYRADYFAAAAPFSARHIDIEAVERGEKEREPVSSSLIPVMANLGCCDSAFKGGFKEARELVDGWCSRYGLTKKWSDYTYMDGGKNCSRKEGLFTHYIFENEDGIPLLHLTETDTKAHAAWPSECDMVWKEWFVHFKKDPVTKKLYYQGKPV
ncbi:MAG: acetylxylan esterase [Clostridiales bacterium]|nr:acetylxylan esterase [Clostridiales bacterium]